MTAAAIPPVYTIGHSTRSIAELVAEAGTGGRVKG